MDFPGDATTNFSAINGFSTIYWRIYTEEAATGNPSSEIAPTSGYNILRHLSRLKDLEIQLRNLNCLVSCYPRRLGLWVFSSDAGFESLSRLLVRSSAVPGSKESTKLTLGSSTLKVSALGSIPAADLVRSLSTDGSPQVSSTANQSGKATTTPGNASKSSDSFASSMAIYTSFMTAIAGAVGLQYVKHHKAIPLGTRTFYTAVERPPYDNRNLTEEDKGSNSALSTLKLELTSAGKILVALCTVHQQGIIRLSELGNAEKDGMGAHPSADVWLAPNGIVARLITMNTTQSAVFAPKQASSEATARQKTESKQRVWKATVMEWMSNVGLPVDHPEDEHWVEVEVSEPFYARLAAEHLRQMDDNQSSSPLKRILWPTKYCFTRTRVDSSEAVDSWSLLTNDDGEPLRFAQTWLETAALRNEKLSHESHNGIQARNYSRDTSNAKSIEIPPKIESLAPVVHYPDLQNASLVYPTPPDGTLAPAMSQMNSDVVGNEGQDNRLARTPTGEVPVKKQVSSRKASLNNNSSADATGVGTGLYDTNDDEDDLFIEMNDKTFGSKGITDADFSFFDDDDEMNDFMSEKPDVDHSKQEDEELIGKEINEVPEEQVEAQIPETQDGATALEETGMQITDDTQKSPPSKEDVNQSNDAPLGLKVHEAASLSADFTINAPLSPTDIKQILASKKDTKSSEEHQDTTASKGRKESRYSAIPFKGGLSLDQKYANAGRFFFNQGRDGIEIGNISLGNPSIPTIGFPFSRRLKNRPSLDELQKSGQPNLEQDIESGSSDESSLESGDDDSDEEASPFRLARLKRKRPLSEAEKSTTSSMEKLSIASQEDTQISKEDTSIFLGNFFSVFTDWSLIGYFSSRQNRISPVVSRKEDLMQLAQLVVDQFSQSSLHHGIEGWESLPELERETTDLLTFLDGNTSLGENERLDLKSYAFLLDSAPNSVETPPARPNPQRREVKGSIVKLVPPHLRLHRGRDHLEVLSASMPFWETFGLEPASGQKDITAYCICPQFAEEEADAFMTRLGMLYSSCNFGKHTRGDQAENFKNGIGVWEITKNDSYARRIQILRALCENLAKSLSKIPQSRENFVVYIVNPFSHGAAFVDICSTFLQLFHKYVDDVDKSHDGSQLNELVLQIVPLKFLFSPTSMVVPPQSHYLNLALEVYSRCPPKDTGSSITCAPPVLLADAVPKAISFRVTSEHFSPFQEGRCLHVAVSRSIDQRWISVAWTNHSGSYQTSMSYCVRARGSNTGRAISELRQEIWEATKDLMERTQTRWKVFLARTEPIEQEEMDAWIGFAERYNQARALPVELSLFSANVAPGLRLELPPTQLQLTSMNPFASTPAATPYGGVSSPDQFGAATPASSGQFAGNNNINLNTAVTPTDTPQALAEADSDAILVDACEESWAVILSHRLSDSAFSATYKPALVSGYLLRRKGVSDSQGVSAMLLNLVHTPKPPVLHEAVLREALASYRDLATLARAKGTLHVQQNTLPWHIATAVKGQELLSFVL